AYAYHRHRLPFPPRRSSDLKLCLSCMGALPKSRGRRCRHPLHPPPSHPPLSPPLPLFPHPPPFSSSPFPHSPSFVVSRFLRLSAHGPSGRPHDWERFRTCLETP